MGRGPPLRMQKRKNQFHWKRITEGARMPERRWKSITAAVGPTTTVPSIRGGGRRRREKGSNFRSNCISREEGIALCENLSPPEIVLGCRKIFESIWKSRRQRQSVRGRIPIVVEHVLNYLSVKLNGIHYPSNSYPVLSRKSICKCYKCALSKFSISPHFSRQFVPFLRIPIIKWLPLKF